MQFGIWDTLFNLLLLVFWFRIWTDDNRDVLFNPYLAPLGRFSDSAIQFLRPVFFGLSPRLIAAVSLSFLIILRATTAPNGAGWILRLGFEVRQSRNPAILASLVFSALSFGVFLFKLWGLSLIFVPTRMGCPSAHTEATLYHLAKPFTHVRREFRPVVLLVCGLAIAYLLNAFGTLPPATLVQTDFGLPGWILQTTEGQSVFVVTGRILISAFAGGVEILDVLLQMVFLLIIGSWISLFTGASGLAFFCRECLDMLMGPLRRHPIRVGMMDLRPLIFILVVYMARGFLQGILLQCYHSLL